MQLLPLPAKLSSSQPKSFPTFTLSIHSLIPQIVNGSVWLSYHLGLNHDRCSAPDLSLYLTNVEMEFKFRKCQVYSAFVFLPLCPLGSPDLAMKEPLTVPGSKLLSSRNIQTGHGFLVVIVGTVEWALGQSEK